MFSDQILKQLSTIIFILAGLGGILASLGYAYGKFFSGRNEASKEDMAQQSGTIRLLNERMEVYERQVEEYKIQVAKLSEQITRLEAAIKEKDKSIKDYLDLLSNRDPKMEKFIDFITRVGNEAEEYMKESTKALTNIRLDVKAITPVPKS